MTAARTPLADLPLPQQAGILCNDAEFRRFVAERLAIFEPGAMVTEAAAAEYLRRQCRIHSRRALATDHDARGRFAALRTDFDAWRGRIAAPRDT